MEDGAKQLWLAEAELYFDECRSRGSCVRASEFATRMRRTPAQAAREFHAVVGLRLKDHFSALQIEHAQELLRTTERGTADIAAVTGFGTARSFYRAFRRWTGVTPTEYRKEMSLASPPLRH